MEELIFGVLYAVIGVILALVARHISKGWDKLERCTARISGTVVGGGHVYYGGNAVPRCEYEVGGNRYSVDGPMFTSGTTAPGLACNCTDREHLPDAFRGPQKVFSNEDRMSNDDAYQYSALSALYPVGSQVDIYYNPADPSESYVQRPVKSNSGVCRVLIMMSVLWLVFAVCILIHYGITSAQ